MSSVDLSFVARRTAAIASVLKRERDRRENARNFRSVLMDPDHKMHDLWEPTRYFVAYGGRGALKSWTAAEYLIRCADDEDACSRLGPERILCTREYQNSVRDSVHRLLRDQIERMGLYPRFYITDRSIKSRVTRSEFIFKGLHNNVQEIKSTEGITKCWVEEAQGTTEDSWQTLIPTIRAERRDGTPSKIIITFNTTDEEAPTYKRFVEEANRPPPEEMILHKINYDENPFLPSVLRKEMEFLRRVDYEAYLHIWEGFPKKLSDAIIFGKKVSVEAFPESLAKKAQRIFFGADFGFARDPSTLIRFFILENTLYIEYEAYGIGVELNEMEQLYSSIPDSHKWPIKGDSARPETISYIRGRGFNISAAEKWKGSVEDGIAHIKGFDRIVVHERCKHVVDEARLYSYKVDKLTGEVLPIIVDKHNHCWDAIRYGMDGHIKRSGEMGIWQRLGQADSPRKRA